MINLYLLIFRINILTFETISQKEVEPGNAKYSSVGGKFIIGKPDVSKENYDTMVFCARDSIEANIPSTIKIIGSYAFSYSKLASILIPSHVTQICKSAFLKCKQLIRIDFQTNSELRTIGEEAFSESNLTSILIPSHVTKICELAFSYCKQLSRVEFEPNSKLRTIGKEAFSESNLTSILIPSHVTKIHESAFLDCSQLQIVEIEDDALDVSFDMDPFSECNIVMLPARKKHH